MELKFNGKKIWWIPLLSLFNLPVAFSQQYSGHVYNDVDANQSYNAGDKALKGVKVSDGYSVVQTKEDGSYELELNDQARFIFISTPSGYKNSKTFYIPVEGKANREINFALALDTSQQKDRLDFIHISDTETAVYGPWIDDLRGYAANNDIPLIMHTGDICYVDGMHMHAQQVNSSLMGTQVRYAVGNHDLVKGKYGEQVYESLFGPTYYSFENGSAYFVVTPMWSGDYKPSYTKDQVIAWLKKDLALKDKKKPLVFINHNFDVGADFILKGEHEQLDLKEYNLKAWLFGHWHNNYVFKNEQHGIAVISTNAPNKGGIDHAAGQFLHISIDGDSVVKIKPIYTNLSSKINLLDPIVLKDKARLLANVYDSKRQVLKVQVAGYDANDQIVFRENLAPQTDWSWMGQTSLEAVSKVKQMLIQVDYQNGEYDMRKKKVQQKEKHFELSWVENIGASVWKAGPLLAGDLLISASIDDGANGGSAITALSKDSGQVRWRYKTKNSVKQKLNTFNNILLATDVAGNVYALELNTGKELWIENLSDGKLPNFVSGTTLYDGIYYTGFGDYLSAIDARSGKVLWRNKEWNRGEGTPSEMLASDKYLITAANWNALFVHERMTGKLLWQESDHGIRFRSSGVALQADELYVPGQNTLSVFDISTGKFIRGNTYNHDLKVMGNPVLLKNKLILGNAKEGVSAYDKLSLERLWNFRTGESLLYSSPYATPDQRKLIATVESTVQAFGEGIVFGASDGYIYVLDSNGKLLAQEYIGAPILADIKVDADSIYVADFAGNIYHYSYKQ